ncbi:MAG: ABC transporter substrate-binding protein [Bacillota bacterium]|nr:ABC transporter substrate-binding protein [Bacillota bacterium]MDW7677467.1 ABC transporter substrate-binding protein [Bacillota bacterium]
MKRKQKVSMVMILVLLVMMLTAPATGAQEAPNTMRIGVTVEVDSLSPLISYSQIGYEVFQLLYDSLVMLDENLETVPGLAKEWQISDDELEWTFTLRDDVQWHDGEPFTSEDVKFTYELLLENELGMYSGYLGGITEILTPDETTVVIRTELPKANMLLNSCPILPAHIWSEVSPDEYDTWPNSSPIGTGPFKFEEFRAGEYLKLAASDETFHGRPGIDELIFVLYANADTMAQSVRLGEIDAVTNFSPSQLDALNSDATIDAISAVVLGFTELSFNSWDDPSSTSHPLLQEFPVRHAIEYSIDKQRILDMVYSGQGSVGTTLVPPEGFYHYEPTANELRDYDVLMANQVLEEAGYSDLNGDGIRQAPDGTPLEFLLTLRADNADEVQAGQMIAGMVAEAGIKFNIETVDDGALIDKIYSGDFDMFIWGWGADLDPTTILNVMTTSQIGNMSDSNYSNETYDRLFMEQQTIMEPDERREVVWEMQRILYEEAPYIILFYDNSLQAVNTSRWTGWIRIPAEGGYFFNLTNYNYLNVQPAAGTADPAPAASGGGIGSTGLIIAGVLVLGGILLFVARKKK